MTMPLPEPRQLQVVHMQYPCTSFVTGYTADQLRARDAQWRAIVAAEVAREREQAWEAVNAIIPQGELQGNGCDRQAQRNGTILAANVLQERIAAIRRGHAP
jgi:hypothetical protein